MASEQTTPPVRPAPRTVTASVMMTAAEYEHVRTLAAIDRRTISTYLHQLIVQHLANQPGGPVE